MIFGMIVGKYTLAMKDDGTIRLSNEDEEAMYVEPEKIEDMIDKFWKENF